MDLRLEPLNDRPELFVNGPNGIIYTEQHPHALLTSRTGEMSVFLSIPNAASPILNYAGCMFGSYFYTKKKGMFLEQNYLLVWVDLQTLTYRFLRETESPNVIFFHRQPYYLLRSGMLSSTYLVKHFEDIEEPMHVNLSGLLLDDSLLIHKNGKMYILRKGKREWREATENVVLIQHPDIDKHCTAYSDRGDANIYVAFSTKAVLLILDTETFAVESIQLPQILDIRHAMNEELIFSVLQPDSDLSILQLPDRYWKSKSIMAEQLTESENVRTIDNLRREKRANLMKTAELERILDRTLLECETLQKSYKDMKLIGLVSISLLIFFSAYITLWTVQGLVPILPVAFATFLLFRYTREANQPIEPLAQELPAEVKRDEEIEKNRRESPDLVTGSEDIYNLTIRYEKLERKYRRVLLQLGRQKDFDMNPSISLTQDINDRARMEGNDQLEEELTDKSSSTTSTEPQQEVEQNDDTTKL